MKKLIAIFTLALLAFASLNAQNQYCLDLEELQDSIYFNTPLGETIFEESAVTVSYDSYTMINGSTIAEPVYVQSLNNSCCSNAQLEGQIVQILGTIDFSFANVGEPVSFVEMQYINSFNQEIGITVNGIYYQAASLAGLPSVMDGDINFSYTSESGTGNSTFGALTFAGGTIEHISIGALDMLLDNICFVPDDILNCTITNVNPIQECIGDINNDGVQNYTVSLDFEHELSISGSFTVAGNGNNYGAFSYADLPVTLGPFEQNETINEFIIVDQAGNCEAIAIFDEFTCIPSGDCSLGPIDLEYLNTDPNNYLYYSLDFTHQNTAGDSFTLSLDGEVQGSYLYSTLPVGLVVPCGSDGLAFVSVIDDIDSDCSSFLDIEQLSCENEPCVPADIVVEVYNCDANSFSLDFEFEINGANSDAFHATVGGVQYGPFTYGSTFYTINNIPFNATGEYWITIEDNLNPNCAESYFFNNNDCFADCNIEFGGVEVGECMNGFFTMYFAAQTTNLSSNVINVVVNNEELGTLDLTSNGEYQLQIPVGDGGPYEVLIGDIAVSGCSDIWTIDEIDCPVGDCGINLYGVTTLDCVGDAFNLSFGVEVVDPTSAMFTLQINGEIYGTFEYGQNEYFVSDILVGDGAPYEIVVFDNESPDCADSFTVTELCSPTDCNFVIGWIEVLDCNDGLFDIEYQILGQSPNSTGHQIFLNDELLLSMNTIASGIYTVYNIPYSPLGFTFTIIENETGCTAAYDVEEFDCSPTGDCAIDVTNIVTYACDNGTFTLGIDVDVVNNTSSFYTATIGGQTYNLSFNSNGQYLHNIPVNGTGVYELVLTDNDNPDCVYTTEIEVNCGDGCNLEVFNFDVDYCDGTSMGISFELNIESASGSGFNVFWDGVQFGTNLPYNFIAEYELADLPYTAGPHQLVVVDSENPDCFYTYLVDEIDCAQDCWIEIFYAEAYDCDGETFSLDFAAEYFATSDVFEIFINDNSYGLIEHDNQFEFSLTGIVYEGEGPYTITVVDAMNPDCGSIYTFIIEDCGSDCTIIEANFNTTDCDDNSFGIIVDFEVLNATNEFFNLYLGTDIIGFFPINQLPLTINGIESDLASLNFSICINDDPNCCLEINIENPCVDGGGFVWPGDANNDNTANIYDLLNVGIGYESEGPARANQTTDWLALDAELWSQEFPNGPNYVFADCDGNGIINEADRDVIIENYGELHGSYQYPETEKGNIDDPSLFIDLPDAGGIVLGQTFTAPIVFGTESIPAENVYGLAFRVNIDPAYMDVDNVAINFQPSWLGVPGVNQLEIAQTIVSESAIDVSITRIDQNNVTGFGALAEFIGIVDDIAGIVEVEVDITNVVAIMISQEVIPVNTPTETVEVTLSSNVEIFKSNVRIYPNPTAGNLIIQNNGNDLIETVSIFSIDGKLLKTYGQANEISIHELPEGIYTVELISQAGNRLFERIVKM